MFEPQPLPRVFGMAPGVDFPAELVAGLAERAEDLSRTVIYVNTARMQRRIRQLFDAGPPRLLPQVRLVTDLGFEATQAGIPPAVSPLRRRLELSQLVAALLDRATELAPRAALYDLSDSLALLMEEMHGEGVHPDAIAALEISDQSGHWQRAQQFLSVIAPFFDAGDGPPDAQARLRLVVEHLAQRWQTDPPDHPVIIAGSTGSRGATRIFMQAVARLPQGAVVLPGFDYAMPGHGWVALDKDAEADLPAEDHPQFRHAQLLDQLGLQPGDVPPWRGGPADPARNALVSLSLRPAPVTDQWRIEGPALGDLVAATAGITLVESDSPRAEASAIALRLRQAAAEGKTAALITPDRTLTRQVSAALDRWQITPDDSAGVPLGLTASGRLLRHCAELRGHVASTAELLVLLKHPLTHSTAGRNMHLLRSRRLELRLRRYGPAFITAADLLAWSELQDDPGAVGWARWIGAILTDAAATPPTNTLAGHMAHHMALAERLCAGPDESGAGRLWDNKEGREARRTCDRLIRDADAAGDLTIPDYGALFNAVLAEGSVRDPDIGHPAILIWGTLEARVGGADLVILGGMNDGTWPEAPRPDPWLNRVMRRDAGLLLPDRQIGLAAHDYQQAIAAPEVWISRSKRSSDAETVPSRWINRLVNLLDGLPDQGGPAALAAMRARGAVWLGHAAQLDAPPAAVARSPRPSPRPPVAARPDRISVTQVKTLVRDPFAIYASKVLRLNKLDPVQPGADPPLRGEIFHGVLERFINEGHDAADPATLTRLLQIATDALEKDCPWPTVRLQWLTLFERAAPLFLEAEAERQTRSKVSLTEARGEIAVGLTGVTVNARADRIDISENGQALIYDYKTGRVPTAKEQVKFDKQLLITAGMVERGAFAALGATRVAAAAFLGVNKDMGVVPAPLDEYPADKVWEDFIVLMRNWQRPDRGYSARMAMFSTADKSDYDHLSRFGEWSLSDDPTPEDLT